MVHPNDPETQARGLISLFEHPHRQERHQALAQVVSLGQGAVPALLEAVQQGDRRTRAGSLLALARIGSPLALDAMMHYVRHNAHEPGDNRSFAMQAIAAAAHPDVPQLRALFLFLQEMTRDPDLFIRAFACQALGNLGDPRGMPLLERCSQDPEHFVAQKASEAMARLATARTPLPQEDRLLDREQLGFALQSNDPARRQMAYLEILRRQRAGQDMLDLALQVFHGPNRLGQVAALEVLTALADARALPALSQAIYNDRHSADLRARALRALAATGRAAVHEVLGASGVERLSAALRTLIQSPDLFVRAAAVSALGVLPEADATPRLVEAAHDPNAWVREEATAALLRLAGPPLLPYLGALARLGRHSLTRMERDPAGEDGSGTTQDLHKLQERLVRLVTDTVALSPAMDPKNEQAAIDLGLTALQGERASVRVEGLHLLAHLARGGARPALSQEQLRTLGAALGSARRELVMQTLSLLHAWMPRGTGVLTARLMPLARGQDEELALEAIHLLGRAGDVEARQVLQRLQQHSPPRLRQAAQDALAEWER